MSAASFVPSLAGQSLAHKTISYLAHQVYTRLMYAWIACLSTRLYTSSIPPSSCFGIDGLEPTNKY